MRVKELRVKPITKVAGDAFCKLYHYSKKVVPNSQLHLGVFYQEKLYGVMQFGPSLCKANMLHLVEGTGWYEFIELNRMAFHEALPKNSESRCLAVALRLIKKRYPHLKWVVTFADGTQCGDGHIYRACGFLLTQIKKNDGMRRHKVTGETMQQLQAYHTGVVANGEWQRDWEPITGYMMRYIYFLDNAYKERLTVPILPYGAIKEQGAGMYRGEFT